MLSGSDFGTGGPSEDRGSGSGQNGEEEGGEERRLIIFLLEQQHSASI